MNKKSVILIIITLTLISLIFVFARIRPAGPVLCDTVEITTLLVNDLLAKPLASFRNDIGRYPTTKEGLEALISPPRGIEDRWRGPYIEGRDVLVDAWGKDLLYLSPGERNPDSYDLYSEGPGIIGNWPQP
jgi:general secretion pathway protein G